MPVLLESMFAYKGVHQIPSDTRKILDDYNISEADLLELYGQRFLWAYNLAFVDKYLPIKNHLDRILGSESLNRNFPEGTDLLSYEFLRVGLQKYYSTYLKQIWVTIGKVNCKDTSLVDIGSGLGYYADSFITANPGAKVWKVDKSGDNPIDFMDDPNWFRKNVKQFQNALLSEILHCKTEAVQLDLIRAAYELLEYNGTLIIHENEDPYMGIRLGVLTSGGSMLPVNQIINLVPNHLFRLTGIYDNGHNHKIFTYVKL